MIPRFPVSDHCDGQKFFNPSGLQALGLSSMPRWALEQTSQRTRSVWPRQLPPPLTPSLPDMIPAGSIAVTWIGHASFLLQLPGLNVLTDPVFASHAGPFGRIGPKRARPAPLPLKGLPSIDLVLLSHNHYDHADLPTLRWLARKRKAAIVTTLGNQAWLNRKGIKSVTELDWWQSHQLRPDVEVTCTPAQHFSARTLWDRNETLWGGFVVKTGGSSIYFAGDSGWCRAFELIGERLGPFDLSLIPIGAYEPRWFMKTVHMNPDEAVQAHVAARSRHSIGMHFGCFQLTNEAIDAPVIALGDARTRHGVAPSDFTTLEVGETRLVRRPLP
jgi:L-ascorbate metabolism protein UlaG (beta-lactamase superfamily)